MIRRTCAAVAAAAALMLWFVSVQPAAAQVQETIYDFTVKDIGGNEVPLETFRGDVLLIVNVASACGYTPQFLDLQDLYEQHRDDGFYVLAFPSDSFNQEPLDNEGIQQFCTVEMQAEFPIFDKQPVTGDDQQPLYRFLTNNETNPEFGGTIRWNFDKFLIGRNGEILGRFAPNVSPGDRSIAEAVRQALLR